jgi:hypothetical protein
MTLRPNICLPLTQRVSKLFPWQMILDVLRQYYPLPALDASSPSSKAAHEEITELRSCLIEVMRLTVVKGVPQGHMDALIKFLNDRVESSQLHGTAVKGAREKEWVPDSFLSVGSTRIDILGFLAYTIAQTIGASQQLYQNLHRVRGRVLNRVWPIYSQACSNVAVRADVRRVWWVHRTNWSAGEGG